MGLFDSIGSLARGATQAFVIDPLVSIEQIANETANQTYGRFTGDTNALARMLSGKDKKRYSLLTGHVTPMDFVNSFGVVPSPAGLATGAGKLALIGGLKLGAAGAIKGAVSRGTERIMFSSTSQAVVAEKLGRSAASFVEVPSSRWMYRSDLPWDRRPGVMFSPNYEGVSYHTAAHNPAAMEAATHFATEATRSGGFTTSAAETAAAQVEKGLPQITVREEAAQAVRGEGFKKPGQYVISPEMLPAHLFDPTNPLFGGETGRIGLRILPEDLPKDVSMRELHSALTLGKDAPIRQESLFPVEDIGSMEIIGLSPQLARNKANKMFREGAEEGKRIATSIFPEFQGTFRTRDLTLEEASRQVDLLTEARGGVPALGSGRVFNPEGLQDLPASKQLWNANDHAAAKAREASTQAVEQVLAKALKIDLPQSFLDARQARLDLVNDPNFNNVIIDMLGNTGKGGTSLPRLPAFLAEKIADPKIDPHLRGAYQQMLSDVLQGKYKSIEKGLASIDSGMKHPLHDKITGTFLSDAGDYVDNIRRMIRNMNLNKEEEAALLQKELQILSDAVFITGKRVKSRKISFNDILKTMESQTELSSYFSK